MVEGYHESPKELLPIFVIARSYMYDLDLLGGNVAYLYRRTRLNELNHSFEHNNCMCLCMTLAKALSLTCSVFGGGQECCNVTKFSALGQGVRIATVGTLQLPDYRPRYRKARLEVIRRQIPYQPHLNQWHTSRSRNDNKDVVAFNCSIPIHPPNAPNTSRRGVPTQTRLSHRFLRSVFEALDLVKVHCRLLLESCSSIKLGKPGCISLQFLTSSIFQTASKLRKQHATSCHTLCRIVISRSNIPVRIS